jgi:hypothetical protein
MQKKVSDLKANPFNSIVYGDEELPEAFLEDIK